MASLTTAAANAFVYARQSEGGEQGDKKDAGQELLDLLKNPFSGTVSLPPLAHDLMNKTGASLVLTRPSYSCKLPRFGLRWPRQ